MSRRRTSSALTPPAAASAPQAVRVALYRRASTDDEGNQPFSLDAQLQRLQPYVPSHPGWAIVEDYVERASAKDIDGRPQLKRLLKDATTGRFDLVLVARIDRWSRSLVDLLDTVAYLDTNAVAFHSATEHFDTTTPMGKLLLQMLGMFAEFERSLIIDRIVRGNAAKIAQGRPLNSRVGYGLRLDEDGRIAADKATIGTVKRIFTEYTAAERRGTKAIATGLNEDGLPGPGGKRWSADSVSRVLRNRAFVGELWHKDRWHPGAHPALVDPVMFEEAQTIATARTDASTAARSRGDFLLSGTIRCAHCQGAYLGTSGTARSGEAVRYYTCGHARRYGASSCPGPSVPAAELEQLITDVLLASYSDSALFTQAIEHHLAQQDAAREPLAEQLTATRAALTDKQRVRQRYQDDYEAGRLAAERYDARAAELDQDIASLQAHMAELELAMDVTAMPRVPSPDELTGLRERLTEGVKEGSVPVRKALFAALVERIEVRDLDDIQPTFRLYDPAATGLLDMLNGENGAGQTPDMADDGLRFASRRLRWS
jgi:site-specific DNA recombinase